MEYVGYLVKLSGAFLMGCFGLLVLVSSVAGNFNTLGVIFGGIVLVATRLVWPRRPNAWRSDPPTEKQLSYAANLGITVPPGATKGEVSAMITAVTGR